VSRTAVLLAAWALVALAIIVAVLTTGDMSTGERATGVLLVLGFAIGIPEVIAWLEES
jgi:hypothetical protein